MGDQRGVDLEAESVLNRIKVDPTISFGIDNANENEQDFSNVTTRGGDDEANDNNGDGNTFGALGTNGFAFSSTKEEETEKQETASGGTWAFDVNAGTKGNEASSWNLGGDSGDKNEADTGGWGDVGGGFSSVKTTEGFGNVSWGNNDDGADGNGWGSFGNTDFNLESMDAVQQPAVNEEPKATETTTTTQNGGGDPDDEDNMAECTFKAIVHLDEVDVAAGTEQDTHLHSFEFARLYRWGTDVTGDPGWKNRATNTSIDFWQQPNKGKIRLISRENITEKLRLNHWLPAANMANAQLRSEKFVQWSGFDTTIHAEDEDDNNGFCMFNCKFRDGETAKKFYDVLVESIENNEKLNANI